MEETNHTLYGKYDGKIIKQTDLYDILPFKKTKIQ